MTSSAYAWVLSDSSGNSFAVADVEVVEYITEAVINEVPLSPDHCPGEMPWRGQLLPVIYYDRIFGYHSPKEVQHLMVLAYQKQPGEPLHHVAVVLGNSPTRVVVEAQESESLPELYSMPAYRPLVRAVFSNNGKLIPVIDLNYLVSPAFRDALEKNGQA